MFQDFKPEEKTPEQLAEEKAQRASDMFDRMQGRIDQQRQIIDRQKKRILELTLLNDQLAIRVAELERL